ncbi:MAG: hypothetical protein ACI9V8_000541 [Urechidicola sp.]|jgi:hypothetical protein
MSAELRHFSRKATKLDGHISNPNDPNISLACAIVNLSAGGAKLKISKAGTLSGEIALTIGEFGPYRAYVAWSRSPNMGVKFLDSPEVMADVIIAVAIYR